MSTARTGSLQETMAGMADGLGAYAAGGQIVDPEGKAAPVWHGVRDLWLANTVLAHADEADGAGYLWDASEYMPYFFIDHEGETQMTFARHRGDRERARRADHLKGTQQADEPGEPGTAGDIDPTGA